ncbi:unnamed protein product [Spirodela intermedia]|uniref:Uncharacterized protein n=1 Tax=Spirodela intermedia TaxID=51605 RepID=A0A7I8KVZ4_SPIIN|nr:unnamed protein product [Spirodela intermedia]
MKVQVTGFESLPDSYADCPDFGHSLTTWDLIISHTEFAYNSSTNYTTSMSPFEISRRFFRR